MKFKKLSIFLLISYVILTLSNNAHASACENSHDFKIRDFSLDDPFSKHKSKLEKIYVLSDKSDEQNLLGWGGDEARINQPPYKKTTTNIFYNNDQKMVRVSVGYYFGDYARPSTSILIDELKSKYGEPCKTAFSKFSGIGLLTSSMCWGQCYVTRLSSSFLEYSDDTECRTSKCLIVSFEYTYNQFNSFYLRIFDQSLKEKSSSREKQISARIKSDGSRKAIKDAF